MFFQVETSCHQGQRFITKVVSQENVSKLKHIFIATSWESVTKVNPKHYQVRITFRVEILKCFESLGQQ
jgi:hypothetical protein